MSDDKPKPITDERVREALSLRDEIETHLRRMLPDGFDRENMPLDQLGVRHEGELLAIIATLEASLSRNTECIELLDTPEQALVYLDTVMHSDNEDMRRGAYNRVAMHIKQQGRVTEEAG